MDSVDIETTARRGLHRAGGRRLRGIAGMTSNAIREELEQAFQRIGANGRVVDEQLKAFFRCRKTEAAAVRGSGRPVGRAAARERGRHVGSAARRADAAVSSSGRKRAHRQPRPIVGERSGRGHISSRALVSLLSHQHQRAGAHSREIASEGGQIVAIMPDRQQFVSELKSAAKVPFPILTDMDNGYALSLNLAIWLGAEMQKMLAGLRDLPSFQGNNSWILPIPATFVVAKDGLIRARFCRSRTIESEWHRRPAGSVKRLKVNPRMMTSLPRAAF